MENEFRKLKDFFQNMEENKAVDYYDNVPFIRTEWLYSKELDIEIIKEVISEMMLEINPKYDYFTQKKVTKLTSAETKEEYYERHTPKDIQGAKIILQNPPDRLILQFVGADMHTKLSISDIETERDNQSERQVKLITLDKLAERIAQKLDTMELNRNIQTLRLPIDAQEQYIKKFKNNTQRHSRNLEIAKKGLAEVFHNAIEYYRYLIEYNNFLNDEEEKISMEYIIQQRQDVQDKREKTNKGGKPRVNEIIEFMQRAVVLMQYEPTYIKTIGERIEETGEIVLNSYTAFVYTDILKKIKDANKEGWLFVCEPQRGDRATRTFYLTREEFEKFDIGKSDDRILAIIKNYLEKSHEEFKHTKKSIELRHTDISGFSKKMKIYITGEKVNDNHLGYLVSSLRKLYGDNELRPDGYSERKKADILSMVGDIPESLVDNTAQKNINEKGKDANGNR